MREGNIYAAFFSTRNRCDIHECHLADTTIVLCFHSNTELSIGRNYLLVISIRICHLRRQHLSDAHSYTRQSLACIIFNISIYGGFLFGIIQVNP